MMIAVILAAAAVTGEEGTEAKGEHDPLLSFSPPHVSLPSEPCLAAEGGGDIGDTWWLSPKFFSSVSSTPPVLQHLFSLSLWKLVLLLSALAVASSFTLAVLLRAYNLHLYRRSHGPPTFKDLQLLGLIFRAKKELGLSMNQLPEIRRLYHQTLGPIYAVFPPFFRLLCRWRLREPLRYQISDPEIAKVVIGDKKLFLQERVDPDNRGFQFKPIRDGLLGLPMGEVWTRHRRLLSPLFTEKYLQIYHETVVEKAIEVQNLWTQRSSDEASKGVVEVSKDLTLVTLDIIGSAGFGVEFRSLYDPQCPCVKAGKWITEMMIRLQILPLWMHYLDFSARRKGEEAVALYERMLSRVIRDFQERENGGKGVEKKRENFVSVLLQAQKEEEKPLTEKEVTSEMLSLLLAGHETTANTLSWCLYLLAKHPDKQTKLREEILRILPHREEGHKENGEEDEPEKERETETTAKEFQLPDREEKRISLANKTWEKEEEGKGEITYYSEQRKIEREEWPSSFFSYERLLQLHYAKACFYEALRVYPTVGAIPRVVGKDCTIGGYQLQKHSVAVVNTATMAKDPAIWDEPAEFRPERFLREEEEEERKEGTGGETNGEKRRKKFRAISPETAAKAPFAFLPFGAGPRSCIGKRFAVNEGIALLSVLVRDLEFELPPDHQEPVPHFSVTLSPRDGIPFIVKQRQSRQE